MPRAHSDIGRHHDAAGAILQSLSVQQHLHPHQPLREAVQVAHETVGFCRHAADAAMRWLKVDPQQSIGRLRRTELTQLARSIERYWRAALEHAPAAAAR